MAPNPGSTIDFPKANTVRDGNEQNVIQVENSSETVSNKSIAKKGCLSKAADFLVAWLENGYGRLGSLIGKYPWVSIGISIIVTGLCLIGMLGHTEESRNEKLWVDQDIDFVEQSAWIREKFPTLMRYVGVIVEVDDVLSLDGLIKLYEVDQKVKNVYSTSNNSKLHWKNICYSVDDSGSLCFQNSLLELWNYDIDVLKNLTKDEILNKVNSAGLKSPVTNRNITLKDLLSDITGNATHKYVSAKISKISYYLKRQDVLTSKNKYVDDLGTEWEEEMSRILKTGHEGVNKLFYSSWTGYVKAGMKSIEGDTGLLTAGYLLIIIYMSFMLGKFSLLRQKVWLALTSLLVIGMSMGASFGLSAAFGVIYGPVHMIIPFLLLGIGVDDVFVIVQTWDNVSGDIKDKESIPLKISRTMRHAGVAITVTSFTDVCAFLIGATTVLPALRSFCIYAGLGILFLLVFSCTFFIPCLAVDARRQRENRDACLFCIHHGSTYQESDCSRRNILQTVFRKFYSKILFTIVGKVLVILATFTMFGFGVYGVYSINQDYDFDSFLPPGSDELMYRQTNDKYFPGHGQNIGIYMKDIDYYKEQNNLDMLHKKLLKDEYIAPSSVIAWYPPYKEWLFGSKWNKTLFNGNTQNESHFYDTLLDFLKNSNVGSQYNSDLVIDDQRNRITASRYRAQHIKVKGTVEEIAALDSVTATTKAISFSDGGHPFANSPFYGNWETNKIIKQELVRNLALAAACVFLVTLFLIANLWTSLIVLLGVAFSLVDLLGFLHFWGMSIDYIISTILVVALGFSVDYSAHIGHAFMTSRKRSRNERATAALTEMGPAVLNGGVSTFLAFCLLGGSESYAFKTFFKVFFLTVGFGLFHGLVFLPVILSILGPAPYGSTESENNKVDFDLGSDNNAADIEEKKQDHVENQATHISHNGSNLQS